MAKGWISVYRKITESWLWGDKPFARGQAWIDILLMASHCDSKALINGQLIQVKRGELITSELKLSERWGWSRTKVRSFLNVLESEKMLSQKKTAKYTAINVDNYALYQDWESEKKQVKDSRKTGERQVKNEGWAEHDKNIGEKRAGEKTGPNVEMGGLQKDEKQEKKHVKDSRKTSEKQQKDTFNNSNNDNNTTTSIGFMDGIGKHYTALTGRWPSPKDEVAITELAGMTQDIDRVKNIMSDIAKKYEPTRPGEKIRSFRYFLPGIKDQLYIDAKRQGVKSSGNGSSGPDDDQYSGIGISL